MRLAAVPFSALRASPHSELSGQACHCGRAGSSGSALALLPIYGSLPPVPPLVFDDMGPCWAAGHISQGFPPVDQEVGGSLRF